MKLTKEHFGKADGKDVLLYTLDNGKMSVKITNYGGIITAINVPDKNGKIDNITLGFDKLEDYLKDHPYFGCIVGRYANRIEKGEFFINDKEYVLAINNGNNALHGGLKGFDKVVWDVREVNEKDEVGIKLDYISPDMEEGYPGDLYVTVTYTLTINNELKIRYKAKTNKDTHVNLTNHTYFNLNGCKKDVLSHELMLNSAKYTAANSELIPTGEIKATSGSDLDFTNSRAIGERIANVEGGGYDHNFIINRLNGELALTAKVHDPESGRTMECYTTEPAVQLYTGNFLDGTLKTGNGNVINKHYGFCLETQHYPNTPNTPAFPSTLLKPDQEYKQLTVYRFL